MENPIEKITALNVAEGREKKAISENTTDYKIHGFNYTTTQADH